MRTCKKCHADKPLSEFYFTLKQSGLRSHNCKECAKSAVRANYRKNRAHYHEYERGRFKTRARKATSVECQRRRRRANPDKNKAYLIVSRAVKSGKIIKGPCSECGTTERVQAHHEDYSRPLDVIWVCFKHHREVHHGQTVTNG